jgi:Nif-specific regulatory protein
MANTNVSQARDHANEIRRLATLLEISQALSGVLNLKAALHSVLDILQRRHQLSGGAVILLDRDTKDLQVEASVGTRLAGQRDSHRANAGGLTDSIIDSGKAVVVPRVSHEPSLAWTLPDRSAPSPGS